MIELVSVIQNLCQELFSVQIEPELTRPDEQFGDYATNVALQLANKLNTKPREVALALVDKLPAQLEGIVSSLDIAGPGFINIRVSDDYLLKQASEHQIAQTLAG